MKKRKFGILLMACLLSGCVKMANVQPAEVMIDRNEGVFPPVCILLNRNSIIYRYQLSELDAVENALKESGAFAKVGRHVDSPIVLDIHIHRESDDTLIETAGHFLSAASLFLIPAKTKGHYDLEVSVYVYGSHFKSYHLQDEFTTVLGLHNYVEVVSNEHNGFLTIKSLVNEFVNLLIRDNMIPRVPPYRSDDPSLGEKHLL